MRVTHLECEAFGPFSTRQIVDFAEATADGLLLISGRTGAGKSTLLDAICFALYGRVPRYDGRPERVRSDHAKPDQPTEVIIEFELGLEKYRLARSPKWEKVKRGGRVSNVGHVAKLWKAGPSGEWEGLASRPTDVGEQLEAILPLKADQFLQVILLSQGGFQKFLQAEPADRQRTLRSLFHTGIYERIEQELDAERKRAEQQLDAVLTRSATLETELDHTLTNDEAEFFSDDSLRPENDHDFETRIAALEAESTRIQALHSDAKAVVERTNTEFELARSIDRLWRRREQAQNDLRRLKTDAELIAELKQTLDASARSEHVVPNIQRHSTAVNAHAHARTQNAEAHQKLLQVQEELQDKEPELYTLGASNEDSSRDRSSDELTSHIEQISARIGALQSEVDLEAVLPELQKEREELDRKLATASERREALTSEVEELPKRKQALQNEILEIHKIAATVEGKQKALAEAKTAMSAATRVEDIRSKFIQARQDHAELAHRAAEASTQLARLIQKRVDGMAGELASVLEPDTECPVCGSTVHPHPAEHTDPVTPADIEHAHTIAHQLEAQRDAATTQVNAFDKQLAELELTLGERTFDDVREELQEQQAALDDVVEQTGQLASRQQHLQELERRATEVTDEQESIRETIEKLMTYKTSVETRLSDHHQRVSAARGPWPSVNERITAFIRFRAALLQVQSSARELRDTSQQLDAAHADVVEVLKKYGFTHADDALQSVLPDAERTTLEDRLQDYAQKRHIAEGVLAEPEMADLPESNADVRAAEEKKQSAQTNADNLRLTEHSLSEKLAVRKNQLTRLNAILRENQQEQQRVYELRQLTDAVKGNEPNTHKMRLEAYVLAGRLEAIVDAANQRFARISADRYLLEHDDSRQSRGKQSGLGLRVFDSYTGKSRSTASLSGGETFLASLALALGLADVVTAEAGGIDLDTLFIDEGFGSLDPESLEQALEVLDSLREGGRAIAAISHVSEMHERIPNQLEVVASAYGPSRLLGAGVRNEPHVAKDTQ